MERAVTAVLLGIGTAAALIPFFTLVGLGVHRHGTPLLVTATATVLVLGPPLMAAAVAAKHPGAVLGSALLTWALVLYLSLPVYFPAERQRALVTGLGLSGFPGAAELAESLPAEPALSTPEVAEAVALLVPEVLPPTAKLEDHQIALPYEGEGRRLSVPVIFGNAGRELEVDMMLDTGATYTTLSHDVLAQLGVYPGPDDPVIRLHTANGERNATVVLLDAVWLGDLRVEGVAIATCDDCANADTVGLLGLNVAGGFNLSIDADRREVVFSRRMKTNRELDVKPFSELSARFLPYPGGRAEVTVQLDNLGRRTIDSATTSIHCDGQRWTVDLGPIAPGDQQTVRRRLPRHEPCSQYEIALHAATW